MQLGVVIADSFECGRHDSLDLLTQPHNERNGPKIISDTFF